MAHAAKQVTKSKIKVIGEGPCRNEMEHIDNVDLKGFLKPESVREIMRRSACLIIPSICHETFGLVAIEAFASGLPVIASRQGSLAELVKDGHTGLLFEPGNPEDLSLKMQWTLSNPEDLRRMGMAARKEYEAKYEPSINYRQLMRIYDDAILEVKQNVG